MVHFLTFERLETHLGFLVKRFDPTWGLFSVMVEWKMPLFLENISRHFHNSFDAVRRNPHSIIAIA